MQFLILSTKASGNRFLINEDPVFVSSPSIEETASGEFGMVIIVGNLSFLESTFDADQASRVESLIFKKLAKIYDMDEEDFIKLIRGYQKFISRVNHPSKIGFTVCPRPSFINTN